MKTVRWVLIIVGILLLVAIGLPFLIDANSFRPRLESKLTEALGREVKVGNLKLSVLSGGVTADDLSIAGDPAFSSTPFIQAKSLYIGVELLPLVFHRKLNVKALTIDSPDISLLQNAAGEWNTPRSKAARPVNPAALAAAPASEEIDLTVKLLKISNCRLTIGRTYGRWKPLVLDQMNFQVSDFSPTGVFPFSMSAQIAGGGSLNLAGKAGPLNATDIVTTPAGFTLKAAQLDLAASGLNDAAPDVEGVVSLDSSGSWNGHVAHVEGKLTAQKLKLAKTGTPAQPTLELDFAADHDLARHSGAILRGDIHIGSAVSHLTGTYAEQGDSMVLKIAYAGPDMAVEQLAEMLPPLGIALPAGSSLHGGTVTANFSVEGPADRPVTTGSLGLNKTRLAAFDMGKKLSEIEKLAGIKSAPDTEIETFGTTVRMASEGIATTDIKLVVPAVGQLSGAGTVSPSRELAFRMAVIVHASGVLGLIGNNPIPFRLEGTLSNPVFKPDIGAIAGDEVKGLAHDLLHDLFGGKKK